MRKHGEKWIGNVDGVNHLLMAIGGRKKYQGSLCHGCSFVDSWDDDCTLKVPPCDMECKIKDFGAVNEDGCLAEERTGSFPEVSPIISYHLDKEEVIGYEIYLALEKEGAIFDICVKAGTKQQAIDAWNQRGGV